MQKRGGSIDALDLGTGGPWVQVFWDAMSKFPGAPRPRALANPSGLGHFGPQVDTVYTVF